MDDLVSVIIPIYNGEKYISDCIHSILSQTYQHIEIIIVDDGSTDNTRNICMELCEENRQLVYLYQENHGVSVARNYGKKVAKGKYILFADADDTLCPEMIGQLKTAIEVSGADVAVCGIYIFNEDGAIVHTHRGINREYQKLDAIHDFLKGGVFENGVWNKLFLKTCIADIEFCAGRRMNEDIFFIFEVLKKIRCVKCIEEPLYNYYLRQDSVSHKSFSERWFDSYYFAKRIYEETCILDACLETIARSYLIRSEYYLFKLMCTSDVIGKYPEEFLNLKQDIKKTKVWDIRKTIQKKTLLNILLIKISFPIWRTVKSFL